MSGSRRTREPEAPGVGEPRAPHVSQPEAPPAGDPEARDLGVASYRVPGMDCPSCAHRIQERLRQVEGVTEAVGNPVSRRLRVSFDGRVDPERIREEIGRLGYAARSDVGDAKPERARTWTSAEALRTYASAALFVTALLLRLAGATPLLVPLPLHDLHLPDLLFVGAAAVGGWNFFPAGVRAARRLSLDMNFLMTVAILGAVAIGEYLEAGAIAFLFSLAELLEDFSVDRARGSIRALMDLSPATATVVRGGREVSVPADEVEPGERVVVRPGEKIPADGAVLEGASAVNQATITGESMPVQKAPGDEVFAGTINGEGWLQIRVERAAGDTTFARIVRLVEEAESRKAPSERFVERFARYYTPAVTVGAVLVALVPPLAFGAPFLTWFVRGLTLLGIACPCALVISTPVAVVSGITAAARNGVLIKGGVHLEAMGEVEVLAFDKTGTLTAGHPRVTDVVPLDGRGESEVLALAAALEARSEHPIARAIVREAAERALPASSREAAGFEAAGFEAIRGKGVRARVDGAEHIVGLPGLFGEAAEGLEVVHRLRRQGKTAVLVGRPGAPAGMIAVADTARAEAADAIRRLKAAGVRHVVLLTGDSRETAEAVAAELGVDEVHAELLPHEKVERVRELEERHGPVAMVGDGVNDAPALAAATVGIAMGVAGSDTALETADVALMGDDLSKLAYLYRLSHTARGVIRQNIGASLGIKLALALGVPLGLVSLILAVLVGDMGASLGVTANSLRLARVRSG